jgi:hypothetical protein
LDCRLLRQRRIEEQLVVASEQLVRCDRAKSIHGVAGMERNIDGEWNEAHRLANVLQSSDRTWSFSFLWVLWRRNWLELSPDNRFGEHFRRAIRRWHRRSRFNGRSRSDGRS